jgi:uncharacterized protein (DUF2236 family)
VEATGLAPKRGSVLWRYAGDARLIATGGHSILLQVAHPTVGAGVSEHSSFRADPWGRLLRTLDYFYVMVYGGPVAAAEMGRRIREMHRPIAGIRPDGERYHALEPEAFAWVHATLADSVVRGHELLGRPMSRPTVDRFYAEWRGYGRLIGVRDRDLPPGWDEFREYFDAMAEERLERTAAVEEVLESLAAPIAPDLPFLPDAAWPILRIPAVRQIGLVTAGLLPADLRDRLGIPWSRARDRELRILGAASRAATPLMPRALRNIGPGYLRWRRDAMAGSAAAA